MNEEKKNTFAELTDEQMEQATGGINGWDYVGIPDRKCPNCGCTDKPVMVYEGWICRQCGIYLKRRGPTF